MILTGKPDHAEIYTDGSCHPPSGAGAWVAIILIEREKIVLSGQVPGTTHNRMELLAVMEALSYLKTNNSRIRKIKIFTDSQYVTGISDREGRLEAAGYSTKKGSPIQNLDLVRGLLELSASFSIDWIKIKAHQKKSEEPNYNIDAEKLARKIVRESIR
jgi:ribonuclease HI